MTSALVIDDNVANGDLLGYLLARAGVEARVARGGDEGITSALADPVDLVLLDLAMPDRSGVDVCEALRADARTAGAVVIAVTAADLGDEIDLTRFDGLVRLPFDPEAVVAEVLSVLNAARRP